MMAFGDVVDRSWSANRLVTVLVELTYRCNLDCFFCYNDLSLRGTPLSFEQYDAFLRDLASMNVLTLVLSGGEPLAHPDFFRIGALARELGFVVRVKSNGHALRGEIARRLRDEVDPFVVEVSLHGATAATHDRQTRVAGSFDRLVANVREMLTLGLRTKVNSTLTRWNESEVAGMYALCDTLGVPLRFDLQVSPRDDGDREPLTVAPTPDGIRNLLAIDTARYHAQHPEDVEPALSSAQTSPSTRGAQTGLSSQEDSPPTARLRMTPRIDDEVIPPVSGKHCGAGSSGIAIDPYGNVYPCVQWRRAVANLHDHSIREIWGQSDAFDGIRRETIEAAGVVARHARGKLLNFCPGLAEVLTGSATTVPAELDAQAAIVEAASVVPRK